MTILYGNRNVFECYLIAITRSLLAVILSVEEEKRTILNFPANTLVKKKGLHLKVLQHSMEYWRGKKALNQLIHTSAHTNIPTLNLKYMSQQTNSNWWTQSMLKAVIWVN